MSPPQWWLLLSGGRINAGLEEYQEILTVDEACEILRIGYNAMYELLSTGKLKAYRNGRVWRIPKVAVQGFILQRIKPQD